MLAIVKTPVSVTPMTNDIDAINQAVSQNVTSLVASVLGMVGIIVGTYSSIYVASPILLAWQRSKK